MEENGNQITPEHLRTSVSSADKNNELKLKLLDARPWYAGVTRYQWLVLTIASAGWVFDQYESQIFVVTANQVLHDVLVNDGRAADKLAVDKWREMMFAAFLLGSTIGGLGAGTLADRFGRKPILVLTILFYSLFSGLTYFVASLWQLAALRFLVAMGVGGEWAVAASLVAEVFPARARPYASGIFHASSVLGTTSAAIVGWLIATEWRFAYLAGILPALLILWVRARVQEPEKWQVKAAEAKRSTSDGAQLGSFHLLLTEAPWNRRAVFGITLAAVGLGTFWAVTVAGGRLAEERLLRDGVSQEAAAQKAKLAYGVVQTIGSGLGLVAFGPISARFGRRRAFIAFQLLGFVIVPITCFVPQNYEQLLLILPVFGFLTLAMHAGYAIYFPELFPTHLRATGASFCFNGGRILAVPVLLLSGWLKSQPDVDLRWAMTSLAALFLVGVVVMFFLPETNRQELPE
jgi:MFS family permease